MAGAMVQHLNLVYAHQIGHAEPLGLEIEMRYRGMGSTSQVVFSINLAPPP